MKKIIFTLAALSLATFSFADDFDFGGDSGDDFGGSSFEESSTPAVAISGEVGAETRAWAGAKNKDSGKYDTKAYKGAYDLSKTEMDAGAYANLELNYEGDYTGANLKLKLDSSTLTENHEDIIDELYANGSFKEGKFQLKAGKMKEVWGKGDKVHVLDNFNANDYSDFIFPDYIDRRLGEVMFKATANLSWDYNLKLEGIFTPWMTPDRFASSGMLAPAAQTKLTNKITDLVANPKTGALPLAYEKFATLAAGTGAVNAAFAEYQAAETAYQRAKTMKEQAAAAYAADGKDGAENPYYSKLSEATIGVAITETSMKTAEGAYKGIIEKVNQQMGTSFTSADAVNAAYQEAAVNYLTILNAASSIDTNAFYPNTYSLRYSQAGLRLTGTLGGIDWGTSYYYGHYKQPSINALKINSYLQKYLAGAEIEEEDKFLQYDQLQVFGLEAAFVLWKLNTRWEFAYNLTEDIAGDDPWVKNNSLAWVAGFDIDIPIHNLNLNVQETGTFILKNNKIKDGAFAQYDVDYNSDDKYTKNKLIVLLSDKWLNEKLTTEVQGIYCIEDKGYMVAPKIEYNVSEGLTFGLRGVYLHCDNENGEFYNFTADSENNDKAFIELTAKYQF
jgi:hypothetical protein